jgi:propanol-preferring alcohol dehydrogenase
MRAMVLHRLGEKLQLENVPDPEPTANQILIAIEACGVCRTDLHIVDGDLTHPKLPLIPGHEIVGRIVRIGSDVAGFSTGMRVGVPWLGYTCGNCLYCGIGRENLCDDARFTGYTLDGGYAELCVADANFCFPMDEGAAVESLAPLLCAGLIGYRALRLAGNARRIGIYGFGAAAHLISQAAVFERRDVYAFTRPGDADAQTMARELGCKWASGSDVAAPELLDAAIIFAPVGSLVPLALKAVCKGGTVVCGGIHMSVIPAFEYELLWGERTLCSVANLTRQDAVEYIGLARTIPVVAKTTVFPLHEANDVLDRLRSGNITGAAILIP